MLGKPSGGLIDVDLDELEAIQAASFFMPLTGWTSGRKSMPRSHYWYTADDPPDKAALAFKDINSATLAELRSSGGQTVAPPGVHESGEKIGWYECTDPAHIGAVELRKAVATTAAAAMLARHWPAEGGRQDAALAIASGLARAGWTAEAVENFIRAVATVAGDDEVEMRCNVATRTVEKIAAGEKATGWPKLADVLGEDGKAVVGRVREWLGLHDKAPAAVADVTLEAPPWPDPPAEEAYHGLVGRIVRTIEPAPEADPAALLAQAFVAFGNAIGRAAYYTVEGDRHHGNEFIVLVGKTSKARKGTSWGCIFHLFQKADEQWAADRIKTGLSSGEGLIWAVHDPIQKQERVKDKGESVRYETVEADPGVEDKRLLVYEPEFANVLKLTERQGNTLSAILRVAWDGRDLRSMTKNSPARATGPHVSLIGHITEDESRRDLTQTEVANGWGNRHCLVCAVVQRSCQREASSTLPQWTRYGTNWSRPTFARSVGQVRRDDEARAVWCEVYGELSEGKPGLAGALLARSYAHVMRLPLLYALLDKSPLIQAPHLMAALAFWEYVERSVYHIFGDSLGDSVADDLLRLLRGCPNGLTRTDISNYFQRHATADRIGRALGLLLQHRLVRREEEKTGGRPSERWYAGGKQR